MRVLVYVPRKQSDAALAHVAKLRAEGHSAMHRDTRFGGDIETCDLVVTDDAVIAQAHRARGIEVRPFTAKPVVEVPDDIPAPAPAAEGGDPESTPVPQRRQRRKR